MIARTVSRKGMAMILLGVVIFLPAVGYMGTQVADGTDDFLFIHHSVGSNWLASGLHAALESKSYVDERNDISYGTDVGPDTGRPDSLAPVPGDYTDMHHWLLWFNDTVIS